MIQKNINITECGEKLLADFHDYGHNRFLHFKNLSGEIHRPDLPAMLFENLSSISYYFCQKDEFHREDGPAIIEYKLKQPTTVTNCYYLGGKKYSFDDFLKAQKDKIVYINKKPHLIDGRAIEKFDYTDYFDLLFRDDKWKKLLKL